jgi:hypothetical protein
MPISALRHVIVLLSFAVPFLAGAQATGAARDTLPSVLVGEWHGTVAVDSGAAGTGVPVRLSIARDGRVTGTVGDATLRDAFMGRNPSVFSRLLGLGTPWMLVAALDGPIVAADSLRREQARMPFDLVDGALVGDFNASGGGRLLSVRARLQRP